ncbi:hypothetical protein F4780DRAFT_697367 [Xylariomycetidae sp. FL0641]|nr:hypothetical protein F4780DRAFT_697367 [Xylariomycetidae sp. FL0641]
MGNLMSSAGISCLWKTLGQCRVLFYPPLDGTRCGLETAIRSAGLAGPRSPRSSRKKKKKKKKKKNICKRSHRFSSNSDHQHWTSIGLPRGFNNSRASGPNGKEADSNLVPPAFMRRGRSDDDNFISNEALFSGPSPTSSEASKLVWRIPPRLRATTWMSCAVSSYPDADGECPCRLMIFIHTYIPPYLTTCLPRRVEDAKA